MSLLARKILQMNQSRASQSSFGFLTGFVSRCRLKLMSHTMKLGERSAEGRVNIEVTISDVKSATDLCWWWSLEKIRWSCTVSLWMYRSQGARRETVVAYEEVRSTSGGSRTWGQRDSGAEEERDGFKVGVGLQKVSAASPCLSAVVINRWICKGLGCLQTTLGSVVRAGTRWSRAWRGGSTHQREEE